MYWQGHIFTFSPLTLLVGRQEEQQVCKNCVMRCWHSYLYGEVQMICIWSSCCHCHAIISCFINIQIGLNPNWFNLSGAGLPPGCPVKEAVKRVSVYLSWQDLMCRYQNSTLHQCITTLSVITGVAVPHVWNSLLLDLTTLPLLPISKC